jgi:hypothetical protein
MFPRWRRRLRARLAGAVRALRPDSSDEAYDDRGARGGGELWEWVFFFFFEASAVRVEFTIGCYLRTPRRRRRFAGAERCSRVLQFFLNSRCGRVRAAEHASCDPFRVLECRQGLAAIIERGALVIAERYTD